MTFISYKPRDFKIDTLYQIEYINRIVAKYQKQGYKLTLRQLYYQLVAANYIVNEQRSYKRLIELVKNGRLAGMISWDGIEDRSRNLEQNPNFRSPKNAIQRVAKIYGIDMWANQPNRVEVWIEKQALIGVIEETCKQLDVPYYACRGYVSTSEIYEACKRFNQNDGDSQDTFILYLGDHDPSGIDMVRDIEERVEIFTLASVFVIRVALNMSHIEQFGLPSNPAKISDSRHKSYVRRFGNESWELDALEPDIINTLIFDSVQDLTDDELWLEKQQQFADQRDQLDTLAKRYFEVAEFLKT